ncbi:MAG: SpoIIE family protein phosphatase [Waddliaceae bacterium]|nr:SpoIIE family protein phosphatase [Waddliaceae bacterium]
MLKNKSIMTSLIFTVITTVMILFSAILGYNYWVSREIVVNGIEKNANDIIEGTANEIHAILQKFETITETAADLLEDVDGFFENEQQNQILRSIAVNNPGVFGFSTSYEPYAFHPNRYYFSSYSYREDGEVVDDFEDDPYAPEEEYDDSEEEAEEDAADSEEDYEDEEEYEYLGEEEGDYEYLYNYRDYYQIPLELEKPMWSEPYFDAGDGGGNVVMSTYSVPLYKTIDGERKIMGILATDVSLGWLRDMVSSIQIAETGYSFLISSNGMMVVHPNEEWVSNETIFTIAKNLGDDELRTLGKDMVRGEKAFVPRKSLVTQKDGWLAYIPLETTGWSLSIFFPKAELMAGGTKLTKTMIIIGIIGSMILAFFIVLISRAITTPIRKLVTKTKELAKGNLNIQIEKRETKNEVGILYNSFATMKDDLKKYIKELTDTTAAKEHIESELNVAHEIQMSMIPKIFPAFPEREEIDLYAILKSAKEVGGDLYNFFMLDDDNLCFFIGDVSGKGVPASLFMAVSNTLIETIAREEGHNPRNILTKINKQISDGNDTCMFVTLLFCIFNMKTGELSYANGGHNPPIIINKKGGVEYLALKPGVSIGIDPDAIYHNEKLTMKPGDRIYLYTDGVTEAFNTKGEEYSEAKLLETMQNMEHEKLNVKDAVENVLESVKTFAGEEPQSDDITMVMLEYITPGNS